MRSERQVSTTPSGVRNRGSGGQSIEQTAIEAARGLLAADGVKGLTIEGVASRTGIAKTTLYRRWRSKEELALAVVLDAARTAVTASTGGDTRTDLINYLGAAIRILGGPMGRVMQGLTSDLATDPSMSAAFRAEVVALRQDHLNEIVERGIKAGELRPDVDATLLHELLFGAIYYRLLFSGTALAKNLAAQIIDTILPSIRLSGNE